MITANIICPAVFHESCPQAFRRAGVSVMDNVKFGKAFCGPAQHARFYFIHRVPAGCGPEAADRVPTAALVDLRRAANVKCRALFESFHSIDKMADYAAPYTERRLSFKI